MSVAQLALFDYAFWIGRGQYLAALAQAVGEVGHMAEPEYRSTRRRHTGWPTLRAWVDSARPTREPAGMPVGAFMQAEDHASWNGPGQRHRVLLVSIDGYVVGESEWCTTEGGARGWLGRNTTPWETSSTEGGQL